MTVDTWTIIGVMLALVGITMKYSDVQTRRIEQGLHDLKSEIKEFKDDTKEILKEIKENQKLVKG